jgi:hypothetical protein
VSCQAFLAVMKIRFKDAGLRKIVNRQFFLSDAQTRRAISLDDLGALVFNLAKLHTSMVFKLPMTLETNCCPSCFAENEGDLDSEIQWWVSRLQPTSPKADMFSSVSCGKYYQRTQKG